MLVCSTLLRALVPAVAVLLLGTGCVAQQGGPPADGAVTSQSPEQVEAAVRATFESYRRALTSKDGQAAAALVSDGTIDYYAQLAVIAGTAGPEEIAARPLVDRLTIALLRVKRPAAELASLDGRELFAYGVEAGLFAESSLADNALGTVRTAGDRAFAQVVVRGRPSPFDYEYVRERGTWLFDVVPTLRATNPLLQQTATRANLTEDEFVFQVVGSAAGRRIDASIFNRP